ncbi:Carbon starvation protein A [Jeotgalibaca dankookensis]|uniref:Carbon starvation protein A n=1 Tax=Jeotgalibaca dankookensis TaxID=708126 RepID=A0A1S6IRR4_9LACT|nr:carbon starvation CstA family protein [Jeotgalibaca dankookensis]AQS54242.1 Carbon starvation protein A [Jeotgalibaca dankookensis]
MYTFILGIILLVLGYVFYSKIIYKNFGVEPNRETPATVLEDGTDFVPMEKQRNWLIQLLNIAGTGPIFGPIMGALYGPVAFLWIVLGSIFAGAVHDYYLGMISLRNNGAHLPELASKYLGRIMKHIVNLFTALLLLLVGTVFVTSPASLLAGLTPGFMDRRFWVLLIFIYYFLSTILPIDTLIGKIYPYFGALLILTSLGVGITLFATGNITNIPELTLQNMHPNDVPIIPGLFFTISCGALSGFHATQSPIISRTLKNESEGRWVFYGAMITEGIIAMLWAAAAIALFDGQTLSQIISEGTASAAVSEITFTLLGTIGGTIGILGVIVLPITSGDTAFRSLRMVIADYIKLTQAKLSNRFMITIPIFAISIALMFIDFNILWRYFTWANQVTAVIALFVSTAYLFLKSRNYFFTLIPGTFMLYLVILYLLTEPIGFNLPMTISYYVSAALALGILLLFFRHVRLLKSGLTSESALINDQLSIREIYPESIL